MRNRILIYNCFKIETHQHLIVSSSEHIVWIHFTNFQTALSRWRTVRLHRRQRQTSRRGGESRFPTNRVCRRVHPSTGICSQGPETGLLDRFVSIFCI